MRREGLSWTIGLSLGLCLLALCSFALELEDNGRSHDHRLYGSLFVVLLDARAYVIGESTCSTCLRRVFTEFLGGVVVEVWSSGAEVGRCHDEISSSDQFHRETKMEVTKGCVTFGVEMKDVVACVGWSNKRIRRAWSSSERALVSAYRVFFHQSGKNDNCRGGNFTAENVMVLSSLDGVIKTLFGAGRNVTHCWKVYHGRRMVDGTEFLRWPTM